VSQGNIDAGGIGGLPSSPNFPFDATTIHAGHRVEELQPGLNFRDSAEESRLTVPLPRFDDLSGLSANLSLLDYGRFARHSGVIKRFRAPEW
jgi:hypothetical protein